MSRARVLLLALAALGAGCAGPVTPPPTKVQIDDRGVFQGSVRASAGVRPGAEAPAHLPGGLGVELGALHASGEGSQTVAAGQQPVVLGERMFAAGQELRYGFELTFVDLLYRFRLYPQEQPVGFELFGGFAYAQIDITVSSSTQRASESPGSAGLLFGAGALWRVRPGTTLHLRLGRYGALPSDGIDVAARVEVGVVQALARNVAVRAGYSTWRLKTDRDHDASNVEVRFSGPSLGLELAF